MLPASEFDLAGQVRIALLVVPGVLHLSEQERRIVDAEIHAVAVALLRIARTGSGLVAIEDAAKQGKLIGQDQQPGSHGGQGRRSSTTGGSGDEGGRAGRWLRTAALDTARSGLARDHAYRFSTCFMTRRQRRQRRCRRAERAGHSQAFPDDTEIPSFAGRTALDAVRRVPSLRFAYGAVGIAAIRTMARPPRGRLNILVAISELAPQLRGWWPRKRPHQRRNRARGIQLGAHGFLDAGPRSDRRDNQALRLEPAAGLGVAYPQGPVRCPGQTWLTARRPEAARSVGSDVRRRVGKFLVFLVHCALAGSTAAIRSCATLRGLWRRAGG